MIGKAGSNFLLDTVIVVAYFNDERAILDRLAGITFYVSSITIGELYFGAYRSRYVTDNVRRIREFLPFSTILPCDEITGDYYGQIKQQLAAKGRPVPENDIWIAAAAMQHGLTLVTRDRHFREIDGLALAIW